MRKSEPGTNDPLLTSVQRIETLLSVLTRLTLRETMAAEIGETGVARKVYDATGKSSVREIAAETGLGVATISKYWTRWESLGLLIKDGQRYTKTFSELEVRPAPTRVRENQQSTVPDPRTVTESGDNSTQLDLVVNGDE
jgi:hypothetical protein